MTNSNAPTYVEVPADTVPDNLRWDVPPQFQGQMIECAFADAYHGGAPAGPGDLRERVTDRSDGSVTYWKRVR